MPRNTHVFGPTFRGEGIVRSDDVTLDPRYGQNPPYHGMPRGAPAGAELPRGARGLALRGGARRALLRPRRAGRLHRAGRAASSTGSPRRRRSRMDNARLCTQRDAASARDARREAAEPHARTSSSPPSRTSCARRSTPSSAGPSSCSATATAPETRRRGLETIERNAELQAQLIDDLLDVSRIISGKLRLDVRPVDLMPVVEAAVEAVGPAAEAKEHPAAAGARPARRRRSRATRPGSSRSSGTCSRTPSSSRPRAAGCRCAWSA